MGRALQSGPAGIYYERPRPGETTLYQVRILFAAHPQLLAPVLRIIQMNTKGGLRRKVRA